MCVTPELVERFKKVAGLKQCYERSVKRSLYPVTGVSARSWLHKENHVDMQHVKTCL